MASVFQISHSKYISSKVADFLVQDPLLVFLFFLIFTLLQLNMKTQGNIKGDFYTKKTLTMLSNSVTGLFLPLPSVSINQSKMQTWKEVDYSDLSLW